MGLLSSFRKNKQESSAGNSDFYSRADEEVSSGRRRKSSKRDEPVDPVLPEKKRARRRLVGAIALVLAVVIGLPMILDPEPKPLPDDINIQIPSRDSAAPVASTKPEVSQPEQTAALAPEEEIVPAKPAVAPAAPVTSQPEQKAPAVASTPEHKPAVTRPEAPAHKPDTASSPAAGKDADAARARAILEGKSVAAAPKTTGKVAIQVAALASQDKVNELQKKLQSAGLKSYTQKVTTSAGNVIRVRVGPFANEAEADKARPKLTKLGLSGKLVPA